MNVQCKNKKCNKINNELVQVVSVLGPFKHVVMGLFRGSCVSGKDRLKGKNPPFVPHRFMMEISHLKQWWNLLTYIIVTQKIKYNK